MRPTRFHLLPACPPRSFRKSQAEALSALLAVSIYMPARNANVDLGFRVDLHVFREVQHASAEVFRPLASYVIRDEYPW